MKIGPTFGVETPPVYDKFDDVFSKWKEYVGAKGVSAPSLYEDIYTVPTFLGIEIEAEGLGKDLSVPAFWLQDQDLSLRQGGKEFKSIPLTPKQAFRALAALYFCFGKKPKFSFRCGTHAHINCTELETEEFKRFVLLSLLCENLIFAVAGKDREQNNNCVPLTRCTMQGALTKFLTGADSVKMLVKNWDAGGGAYKYSAVNFARLKDIGTVEFRHLGGTADLQQVYLWLAMLLKLYQSAIVLDNDFIKKAVEDLNSNRSYYMFVKKIFGAEITATLANLVDIAEAMYPAVTKVKEMTLAVPHFDQDVAPNSAMMEYAEEVYKVKKAKAAATPKIKKETPGKK